ncbi:MAG TPA: hypothetical protein VMW49_04265 [Candidatus Dormibacteraeota bacterium]|nr:hypothetical protein [Candidatus Dormibacteraeota bacterium]
MSARPVPRRRPAGPGPAAPPRPLPAGLAVLGGPAFVAAVRALAGAVPVQPLDAETVLAGAHAVAAGWRPGPADLFAGAATLVVEAGVARPDELQALAGGLAPGTALLVVSSLSPAAAAGLGPAVGPAARGAPGPTALDQEPIIAWVEGPDELAAALHAGGGRGARMGDGAAGSGPAWRPVTGDPGARGGRGVAQARAGYAGPAPARPLTAAAPLADWPSPSHPLVPGGGRGLRRPEWLRRPGFGLRPSAGRAGTGALAALPAGLRPGEPMVVAVGSGKGGSGRSTVALGLAAYLAAAGGPAVPVLLVDSDLGSPDQDLRLPVSDRVTLAELLDALPEIAVGTTDLEAFCPADPATGLRVLLAPPSRRYSAGVGPEHLAYVFTYLVAPAYAAVVVDLDRGSPLPDAVRPGQLVDFWLQRATALVVPCTPDPASLRAAGRYLAECQTWGFPASALCPVLVGDQPALQRRLGLEGELAALVQHRLPHRPAAAAQATVRRCPLSLADPAMRSAFGGLAADLISRHLSAR